VVARDIPPYAIAVGAPAVAFRYRFEQEIIDRLLASEWWNWSRAEIQSRPELFSQPLTAELLDQYL
jgi:virginiamycin A acetyltransferase